MEEEKHHHHLFHHKKEEEGGPVDYKKEVKHHSHLEKIGGLGAVAAGAFALHEKHKAKKDVENAHKHKIQEGIAAVAAVGAVQVYTYIRNPWNSLDSLRNSSALTLWASSPTGFVSDEGSFSLVFLKILHSLIILSNGFFPLIPITRVLYRLIFLILSELMFLFPKSPLALKDNMTTSKNDVQIQLSGSKDEDKREVENKEKIVEISTDQTYVSDTVENQNNFGIHAG
ncbi:hypothetical protein K7X08_026718 [Anisodus acutangulus]|uniref:Uncharacterized protein n=1 Tax=Anisodus acutangulus TaxID=402998 RepID=A0A9Q1LCB5_9SOLA|nr:hypothetical protein K7X08_026718 [Anisodus acutangulus]